MLVAIVAIVFAMAGSALAAQHLITGADVKDESLTGRDIAESSLGYNKLSDGAQQQLNGSEGPRGPTGSTSYVDDVRIEDAGQLAWFDFGS
jgi:hypothetical protein